MNVSKTILTSVKKNFKPKNIKREFQMELMDAFVEKRVNAKNANANSSLTVFLWNVDLKELARLVADEALQFGINLATKSSSKELVNEASDLFYTMFVALKRRGVKMGEVMDEITNRIKDSATKTENKRIEALMESVEAFKLSEIQGKSEVSRVKKVAKIARVRQASPAKTKAVKTKAVKAKAAKVATSKVAKDLKRTAEKITKRISLKSRAKKAERLIKSTSRTIKSALPKIEASVVGARSNSSSRSIRKN